MQAAEEIAVPSTVAEFLQLHQLDKYAEAFEEEGWDSLQQLRSLSTAALEQLIDDTKMKSGHAFRLREALGGAAPSAAGGAAEAAVPKASPPSSDAPPQPAGQPALTGPAAKVYAKISESTLMSELQQGNIIETWADPLTKDPVFAFSQDGNSFYCKIAWSAHG